MSLENRLVSAEEQRLYSHLLGVVQSESPDQMVDRMRQLFVEGMTYQDEAVLADLANVAMSGQADEQFRFVLNRCIHILTNRWQGRPQTQQAIPALVNLLETSPELPIANHPRGRAVKRQRELMKQFLATEQYASLKRLSTLMLESEANAEDRQPLRHLIGRYPYLYSHCLISDGASHEDQYSVRMLQENAQHKYEVDLAHYVTYQLRKSDLLRDHSETSVGRILTPVKNPTLLSDAEVSESLRYFVGKVNGQSTHRDVAHRFIRHSQDIKTFGQFKDDLYSYLADAIEPEYGRRQLNNQLYQQMRSVLPEQDDEAVNELLVMRLCSQLLNFLIVENSYQRKHFVFVDMIANIGPMFTTGLLLKLVLICRKIKPYLEKRLSILFNHYEGYTQGSVEWLVMLMENLNIALSSNFGQMNLAFVHRI
jgi:hypothetical protein